MPTLLVRGEHDATSIDEDMRLLFSSLGGDDKQCVTVGDAGHFLCAERRAPVFLKVLTGFADRLLGISRARPAPLDTELQP
ncbi:hypothetical protein D9M68_795650 [compost metagenome]